MVNDLAGEELLGIEVVYSDETRIEANLTSGKIRWMGNEVQKKRMFIFLTMNTSSFSLSYYLVESIYFTIFSASA